MNQSRDKVCKIIFKAILADLGGLSLAVTCSTREVEFYIRSFPKQADVMDDTPFFHHSTIKEKTSNITVKAGPRITELS